MMALLALIAGLLLSGTAAFYSIIGLLAIFPGAIVPITLMGGSLEFAKLVAASWLYRHWSIAPKIIKGYFVFAIIVLMFITSLGTFGYLSKVHLESSIGVADNSLEIAKIEQQIISQQRQIENAQRSLDSLDAVVEKSFFDGAKIRTQQKAERTALNNTIENADAKIDELNTQLVPLRRSNIESEAKIGPLKYIAELIYGKDNAKDYNQIKEESEEEPEKPKDNKPKKPNYVVEKVDTVRSKGKKKKKVAPNNQVEYNSGIGKSIYNFMMRDDFGISHTDKVEKNESTRKTKEK
jgi:hypothetical protein